MVVKIIYCEIMQWPIGWEYPDGRVVMIQWGSK